MKMSKNKKINRKGKVRVIQINGLRGILSVIFVVTCLTAGFVGFPSFVLYKLWNFIAGYTSTMPVIDVFQGLLLWGILATSYLIINEKKRYLVAFEPKVVSGKNIREIINEIKAQSGDFSAIEELQKKQTAIDNKETNDDTEKVEDKI